MILNELYKLNELSPDTLASYKKAAGADATAADAAGDYARGNKRFKGIVKATKKQFANDTKGVAEDDDAMAAFLSRGGEIQQLKPQRGPKRSGVSFASKHIGSASGRGNTKGKVSGLGANTGKSGKPVVTAEQAVAEGSDPASAKFGKYIKKYFDQIYEYGDDGLNYLDNNAPFWASLFDKHDGDIDYIIAMEPADVLKQAAVELKDVAGDLKYELDEQGITEGHNNSRTIIAEALITERLWNTAGRKLMEAQLTADQITQIFQQIQQDATAAGGNRTLIGKGKDAADAVSSAWTNLKDKIYNSKPMSNFASAYDTAAEKLKQATGGDAGAMKYVQKYRDFATKHPMLQSAIYAALIAASGISGVGLAGAAALGLFKLVDQALQGKDIRSAMWSGVKTGAQAFAAGQIGQALKGQPAGGGGGEITGEYPDGTPKFAGDDYYTASKHGDFSNVPDTPIDGSTRIISDVGPLKSMASDPNLSPVAQKLAADLAAGKNVSGAGEYLRKAMAAAAQRSSIMGDMPDGSANAGMRTFMSLQNLQRAIDDAGLMSTLKESVTLSESQIFFVIGKIVERHRKLDEGLMDTIKGAAGKAVGSVVNYAKTKGTNLTTKITADKLLQAWKKAGSPMDSATVAKVIQDAGVPAASVQQAYSTMKIPFDAAPAAPAPASGPGDPTPLLSPAQLAAKRDPAAAPAATPAAPAAPAAAAGKFPGEDPQGAGYVGRREVARRQAARAAAPAPAKTPDYSRQSTGYSGGTYTIKQPAAPAAPAAKPGIPSTGTSNSVFGRTSTSSTGGISQPTATGIRHTAKANNPNQPAVAEAKRMGEYGRVLTALGLYYPDKFSMEELNTPGWHKVIANKAEVPVEYAGQVINDFTRSNQDDDEDDEQGLNEFAMGGGGDDDGNNGFSDDTLRQLAAQWYNGDEDPKVERTLMAAGWEIGQDEGYDDEPGVFVVQAGDVNGRSYMSWPATELEVLSESIGDELQSILKSAGLVCNR